MIEHSEQSSMHLLAVSVGNSNTSAALCTDATPGERLVCPNSQINRIVEHAAQIAADAGPTGVVIAIASVDQDVSQPLAGKLEEIPGVQVVTVGRDLPIPIERAIDPDTTPGQDRLLNALAAYSALGQACVVVDAGTAVTIDFVDGEGTFQGGAIAPGLGMMLRSLHEQTAVLPQVAVSRPMADKGGAAFAKRTEDAMLLGAFSAIRGSVRLLTERYAEAYGGYPSLIVTGGDAELLFSEDELVDRIVPDLTLRGIAAAFSRALAEDE